MDSRLKKISAMISELEHLSAKEGRNKDDVKAFVKDMMRVFSHGDVSDNKYNIISVVGENTTRFFGWLFSGYSTFFLPSIHCFHIYFFRLQKGYATGFSGDIGSGPTTAYDALPPKKWAP